jgi:hypothetical protein
MWRSELCGGRSTISQEFARMIKTQAGALSMTDNPGNVMDYILIAVPALLLLAAAASAVIRRWRIRKVAQLRSHQYQDHLARRHLLETQAVIADPGEDEIASTVAAAFDDIDRRIDAALAALDEFKVPQPPDGVAAHR